MDKNKKIILGGLIALVFLLVVGFAAFGSQLTIKGTARVSTAWDVHISSITPNNLIGSAQNIAASVGESGLSATFETDLKTPGDSITYTVTVVNAGTVAAKLSDIKFYQSQDQTLDNKPAITYSYSQDKIDTDSHSKLAAGQEITFDVTVKYTDDYDPNNFTEVNIENDLEMVLTYTQDEEA